MMNKILLITFLIISNFVFGQSKYNNGFNDGYKKGYCQDKGIGCIEPIAPIAPIPAIGEDLNNYQDGYNRGFQMGLKANSGNNNNSSTTRERYKTSSPQYVDDFVYNPYKDPNYVNLEIKVAELKFKRIKELYQNGLNSYNNDDYSSAISYANEIINIDASFPKPYALKAMSQFYKGEILNSYNNISKAKELNYTEEDNIKLINDKVRLYMFEKMKDENYQEVKYFCENVWYKNDFSYYFLGLANYYLNDLKEAKKAFKKVDNFKPADEYLTAIKENKILPNPYVNNTENQNSQANNNEFDKIESYYKSKDYDKILSILEPVEKAINVGIITDKNAIFFLYANKTYSNYYLKNYAMAISDATMAINNDNNEDEKASLYFMRAMAKTELKDYYGANSDFDYLIDNYGKNNYKENSLGTLLNNKAYNLILLKDFERAKSLVDRALSLEKNIDYIWDTKGELEYYLGNYNESVKAMTNSLNLSKRANSYYYRGLSNIKLGKKSDGCFDLSKAGELGELKAYDEINKYCK